MINLDKVSEGVDYELIPVEYVDNQAAWDVRVLRGEFTETVIRYGTIRYDGTRDCLTFDFRVVDSPDPELSSDDITLQDFAGQILEDVIERGMQEGYVYGTEKKDADGNTIRTDDSTESID